MAKHRVNQIDLFGAICKFLDKRGVKAVLPRQINAVIAACDGILEALNQDEIKATEGMGLTAWLRSDATGTSSLYMASYLAPLAKVGNPACRPTSEESPWPHDPSDFGRCVGLLEAVPELRSHLSELANPKHGAAWNNLVAVWDELESLYREELPTGSGPRLFARMKELGA